MKQLQLIHTITDLLIQASNEVKDKGNLKLYDINQISEDVLIPILNIVFDTNLINLNTVKANYPGIDLATDEHITIGNTEKRIAFQITSTNSIEKIKKTLKGYVDYKLYEKFDEIYIYNLIEKQAGYQNASIVEVAKIVDNKFTFDLSKNIIDRINLNANINTLTPISKIETICNLLEDQFIYRKKSLLSLEIWESDGKIGYGFSNLLNGIDLSTYYILINDSIPNEAKDILHTLLLKYNDIFAQKFENEKADKFVLLGFNTYLKAGFTQALKSFQEIKDLIHISFDKGTLSSEISDALKTFTDKLDESDYPLVNQPINHPAIKLIKNAILQIFSVSKVNEDLKNLFIKDFNKNIETCIRETFGAGDYARHLEQTKDKWLTEIEEKMLTSMKKLSKLGFVDGEELEFQETYGTWQDVRVYNSEEKNVSKSKKNNLLTKIEKKEHDLKKVETLIEDYFTHFKEDNEGCLNSILFLIADFGKGKTSFLHHFASRLAQNYIKTHEGLFPVYLNLNEYDKYSNSSSLGVIANYLITRYAIDIQEDYYKKKDYFFLIDSLDECGKLTETNIDKVIKDIHEIQNLDRAKRRYNRILIASRPIADGLKEQITKYKVFPITVKNEEQIKAEETKNYISIYGFKKEQFDNYIEFALKQYLKTTEPIISQEHTFSDIMYLKIKENKPIELYSMLLNTLLKENELKRPIFAYMIYKQIISNSNFIDIGKTGLYISFLNQLSKEAKHKEDKHHIVSLKDEFVYRNILHASALLWQYRRQSGEQTSLTKADICRTIEGKEIDKDDRKVLKEFQDIDSIHFLSHSYLGEKENTLHFQHQSFAEILLAEYYLKVFIKCAIDEDSDFEETSVLLSVGLPTDQTISFFRDLLNLLKECVLGGPENKTIPTKRELFVPLLASMCIRKHNKKLYSTRLNVTWFEKYSNEIFSSNKINDKLIKDFPITKKELDKIELLCQKIISSPKTYLLENPGRHTALYSEELISVSNLKGNVYEIDKWLALIAGNILGTNIQTKQFFNSKLDAKSLFDLIRNWNYNKGSIPIWGRELFQGICMESNQDALIFTHLIAYSINFSYSVLKGIIFKYSILVDCDFSNSIFDYFNIEQSDITRSKFENIAIKSTFAKNRRILELENRVIVNFEGPFSLSFCFIAQGVLFPSSLNNVLKGKKDGFINYGSDFSIINNEYTESTFLFDYFIPLKGVFKNIIKAGKDTAFILSCFIFELEEIVNEQNLEQGLILKSTKEQFEEFIYSIEKEVEEEKK